MSAPRFFWLRLMIYRHKHKLYLFGTVLALLLVLYIYSYSGTGGERKSTEENLINYAENEQLNELDKMKESMESHDTLQDKQVEQPEGTVHRIDKKVETFARTEDETVKQPVEENIEVIITFAKAAQNYKLQTRFEKCINSIMKHSSVPIRFNIIGDEESHVLAGKFFENLRSKSSLDFEYVKLDVHHLAHEMRPLIEKMQDFFSYRSGAYYNDPLFFLSPGLHLLLKQLKRAIMLDSDVVFRTDIRMLYDIFEEFKEENVIGLAHEQQPVYRHTFYKYRKDHKGTQVGDPPPNGLTGFNSGVMLLDFEKIRSSKLYANMQQPLFIKDLSEKFEFKGHLGDQDYYTLLEMEHPELFYILPCTWNRQLCTWWKTHGYDGEVFDSYHNCEGRINVWHGNCETPIPED